MKALFLFVSFMVALSQPLHAQNKLLGYWIDEPHETVIEIYKQNDFYHARIVWLKDSLDVYGQDLRDVMNSDPKQRSRKVIGSRMLSGFSWTGGELRKGEIYNYKSGNEYNGKIYLGEEGDLRLKGYFSILFFLGRTKTWKRPNDLSTFDLR